ncbi:uncharacterized protein LOC115160518 [Salmo trutta]|uniref:uncharacterized protein LOC115160518 n=1 Tax=Salmo trutta TaxID=8032 RepID=UPI0011316DF2|nr:uncharacterized protein LOC115160518 [Salmo trutta]
MTYKAVHRFAMGLALIVFGQHLTKAKLTLQNLHLDQMQRTRVDQLKERQWLENLLKGQLDWKKKNVEEMEAEVNKLTEEEGKKKTEVEACQADKYVQQTVGVNVIFPLYLYFLLSLTFGTKKQKEEDFAPIQKEQSDIEATFKTEKEAWTGEITTLKQQLEQSSKVCGFVKDSTDTVKLCPPKEGAAKAEAAPVQGEPASAKPEAAPVKPEVAPAPKHVHTVRTRGNLVSEHLYANLRHSTQHDVPPHASHDWVSSKGGQWNSTQTMEMPWNRMGGKDAVRERSTCGKIPILLTAPQQNVPTFTLLFMCISHYVEVKIRCIAVKKYFDYHHRFLYASYTTS